MKAPSFRFRCKRLRRDLGLKLRLSAALLVAGLFSLSRPRDGWPRIMEAFRTWLRWARDPKPAPFWIYVGRLRACNRCPFFDPKFSTCGSCLDWRRLDEGCKCFMPVKCAILDADCWAREQGTDESLGWPDSVRRLSGLSEALRTSGKSGIASGDDGRNATTRRCGGCGRRGIEPA